MKIGFAKHDITPPVGGELSGFGPFLLRTSSGVFQPLYARTMAVEHNKQRFFIISCDIIGLEADNVLAIRRVISAETGVEEQNIAIYSSHTHSGPNPTRHNGWGQRDPAYSVALPYLAAKSAVKAMENLSFSAISHAMVPCEGIALNREYEDARRPELEKALAPDWRPEKPEHTDTACHVISVHGKKGLTGFIASHACHPAVCRESNRLIHGDFCGVALNATEAKHPGAVGLFIQGAHGDIDPCVSHPDAPSAMRALDIIAGRFADSIETGISQGVEMPAPSVKTHSFRRLFPRQSCDLERLREIREQCSKPFGIDKPDAVLHGAEARRAAVMLLTLDKLIEKMEKGEPTAAPTEIHGIKIGHINILGSGFETFQAIKNDVIENSPDCETIVASLANDGLGYAPDKTTAAKGGYAADFAPFILGTIPYKDIHGELAAALSELGRNLEKDG